MDSSKNMRNFIETATKEDWISKFNGGTDQDRIDFKLGLAEYLESNISDIFTVIAQLEKLELYDDGQHLLHILIWPTSNVELSNFLRNSNMVKTMDTSCLRQNYDFAFISTRIDTYTDLGLDISAVKEHIAYERIVKFRALEAQYYTISGLKNYNSQDYEKRIVALLGKHLLEIMYADSNTPTEVLHIICGFVKDIFLSSAQDFGTKVKVEEIEAMQLTDSDKSHLYDLYKVVDAANKIEHGC